jgi:hypothetical protein
MLTIKYKCGYIHENFTSGRIVVQVDPFAYAIEVKSILSAKMLITKHLKCYGGNK